VPSIGASLLLWRSRNQTVSDAEPTRALCQSLVGSDLRADRSPKATHRETRSPRRSAPTSVTRRMDRFQIPCTSYRATGTCRHWLGETSRREPQPDPRATGQLRRLRVRPIVLRETDRAQFELAW